MVRSQAALRRWRAHASAAVDLSVLTEAEFAELAEPGSDTAWRGYDLMGLTAQVDRGGFQQALDRKGRLDAEQARQLAERSIDHALNQLYRASKNSRDGDDLAAALDLAELVPPWLTAAFALEGRHRPYNKFLT